MNGLERILAARAFQPVDRLPLLPQVFGHAAVARGVDLARYLNDGAELARCQAAAREAYDSDGVFALLDVNVETEALGSRLRYPTGNYPVVETYVLEHPDGVGALRLPDPRRAGRMPVALEAARLLRAHLGDRALVAGCVVGPMTLACQLLGAEKTLFAAMDEPAAFERLLEFATDVALAFGTAQVEAGAHLCVVFDPSASPAVVPAAFFREFLVPRQRRLGLGLKAAGALAHWLHIAGPVEPILPLYPGCGVDIANLDYCVDPVRARALVPELCFEGNVRPLAFVDSGPEAILQACRPLLDLGPGFILSSGCEIPLEARPECIRALAQARDQGSRP